MLLRAETTAAGKPTRLLRWQPSSARARIEQTKKAHRCDVGRAMVSAPRHKTYHWIGFTSNNFTYCGRPVCRQLGNCPETGFGSLAFFVDDHTERGAGGREYG